MTVLSPLIEPRALAALQGGASAPVVLDVRWRLGAPSAEADHRAAHIPGAVFVDLERSLSGRPGPGRHPLPYPAVFESAMRDAGVSASHPVVSHDWGDGAAAARAWWLLRYFGHADARVLDGGWTAWVAAALPTTAEASTPAPGDFRAAPGHLRLLDAGGAAAVARRGVLLDARAPQRYRGEAEPVDPVAGHIPGARNAPADDNLGPDGRFLEVAALRRRFTELGIRAGSEVGAYCGSGVTAAQEILALALAGIDAALYVGSWSDWITDPARPVAAGSTPG